MFLILLIQPWGEISTDTKLDLLLNPAGFLHNALYTWTDTLTLGQLQNQAYGYLFPQGLFFLATQFLPDWIAERLWWWLVLGTGYSGMILLLRRLGLDTPHLGLHEAPVPSRATASASHPKGATHPWIPVLIALSYALAPRTLSTLTTISSETWPTMLAPWVVWALLGPLSLRTAALATIPVALMGAVNATATLAACVPAGVVLVWRILHREARSLRTAAAWLVGCALVSAWWIGPLLVLGRYSAPFTDFIESATVTTRWLNPLEILRGTTSWTPFVDLERTAGVLLAREPVFILLTGTVAAIGLAGLALYPCLPYRRPSYRSSSHRAPSHRTPSQQDSSHQSSSHQNLPNWGASHQNLPKWKPSRQKTLVQHTANTSLQFSSAVWIMMLLIGVLILGAAHGPLGSQVIDFLDGSGAPLRNLHKCDPLIRMPLAVGCAVFLRVLTSRDFSPLGIRGRTAHNQSTASQATDIQPPDIQPPGTQPPGTQPPSNQATTKTPSWLRWNTWASLGRRDVVTGLVVLVMIGSMSPAWSGRLLPVGTWRGVPSEWYEAAEFVNTAAAGTRTLLYPARSFARDEWGWTRDEPAQPLLEVPWAVRDAIPLVDPEATRGLDGLMSVLEHDPKRAPAALESFGIGAVLVRAPKETEEKASSTKEVGDKKENSEESGEGATSNEKIASNEKTARGTDNKAETDAAETPERRASADSELASPLRDLPGQRRRFGDLEVIVVNPAANYRITDAQPVRIAGGGDIVPLWQAQFGGHPVELVGKQPAEVITDTPALVDRNYGTLEGPTSAYLTPAEQGDHVDNPVPDYPSAGTPVSITEKGARVTASSAADNADSFGGARPSRSVTAAVDQDLNTAWWPAPGPSEGQWLQFMDSFEDAQLRLRVTDIVDATISSDTASIRVRLNPAITKVIGVPGRKTTTIRVTLHGKAGIREMSVVDHPISRVVTIPDSSPAVKQYFFQRHLVDMGNLIRRFTAPREMTVVLDSPELIRLDGRSYKPGVTIQLTPGTHTVKADGDWLALTEPDFREQLMGAVSPAAGVDTSVAGEDSRAVEVGVRAADSPAALAEAEAVTSPLDISSPLLPSDQERLILTGCSFNKGQRAFLEVAEEPNLAGEHNAAHAPNQTEPSNNTETQHRIELEPRRVDSGLQAFLVPAGATGTVHFTFAGEKPYQLSLLWGAVLGLLTLAGCLWLLSTPKRRRSGTDPAYPSRTPVSTTVALIALSPVLPTVFLAAVLAAVGGIPGVISVLVAWAIRRFTLIPNWVTASVPVLIATLWLSRSPWPDVGHVYGGDVAALGWLVLLALAAASHSGSTGLFHKHEAGGGDRNGHHHRGSPQDQSIQKLPAEQVETQYRKQQPHDG